MSIGLANRGGDDLQIFSNAFKSKFRLDVRGALRTGSEKGLQMLLRCGRFRSLKTMSAHGSSRSKAVPHTGSLSRNQPRRLGSSLCASHCSLAPSARC
jgi:hypothetical protein